MCAPVFYITGQSIAQLYSVSIMGFSICATLYVANDYPAAFSGVVRMLPRPCLVLLALRYCYSGAIFPLIVTFYIHEVISCMFYGLEQLDCFQMPTLRSQHWVFSTQNFFMNLWHFYIQLL
jgi:hypothetical protein